jgi:photosystem II stability/assembly factor-like uncharacterized protein
VYKSINCGDTWTLTSTGLPADWWAGSLAIDPHTPDVLYAGSSMGGVYRSIDGGHSWGIYSTGLSNPKVYELIASSATPAVVLAGTRGGGVFSIYALELGHRTYLPMIQR